MIPSDPSLVAAAVARGARAKALLSSEAYQEAMRDLENYHVTAMVACHPGKAEQDARDYHHLMLHALRELATQLVGYVEVATELENPPAEPDDPIEDDL